MPKVSPHAPAHDNKNFGMQQGVRSIPQSKLRKETTPRWNQSPRYESGFNGYCYFCFNFGHFITNLVVAYVRWIQDGW